MSTFLAKCGNVNNALCTPLSKYLSHLSSCSSSDNLILDSQHCVLRREQRVEGEREGGGRRAGAEEEGRGEREGRGKEEVE